MSKVSIASSPHESARLDAASFTFKTPTADLYDEVLDFGYQLNSYVDPTCPLTFQSKGRHFTHVFNGRGLVVLEGTPPLAPDGSPSQARNAGMVSLVLNGQFFGACDAEERAALMLQVAGQTGFYRCTRLDAQITLLNPSYGAERIVNDVAGGRLWVYGFNTERSYGDKNRDGLYVSGCTQYWGGKQSDRQARSYDKAAEQDWDIPAVRHELQLRGTCANDRFIQLKGALRRQKDRGPLLQTAESDTVKTMLAQDLDYRDTSKWAGKAKPKNWAQSAPVPGWWRDAVGDVTDDFTYSRRPQGDLDATYAAAKEQYQRKLVLKFIKDSLEGDQEVQELLMAAFMEGVAATKDGDAALIHRELPGVELGVIQEVLAAYQGAAARYTETGSVFRADQRGFPFEMRQSAPRG